MNGHDVWGRIEDPLLTTTVKTDSSGCNSNTISTFSFPSSNLLPNHLFLFSSLVCCFLSSPSFFPTHSFYPFPASYLYFPFPFHFFFFPSPPSGFISYPPSTSLSSILPCFPSPNLYHISKNIQQQPFGDS